MRLTCPVEGQVFLKNPARFFFFTAILLLAENLYFMCYQMIKKEKKKYQEKEEIEEARRESVKVCLKFPEGNKKSFSLRYALFLFIHLLRSVSSYILFVGLSLYQTEGWG